MSDMSDLHFNSNNGNDSVQSYPWRQVPVSSPRELNQNFPLHEAARRYDSSKLRDDIELLIRQKSQQNTEGETPLHVLLKDEFRGHECKPQMLACLRLLVSSYGCDVNARIGSDYDPLGETPLSLSVHHGFQEATLFLVQHGAETATRTRIFNSVHALATSIALNMPEVMTDILDRSVKLKPDEPVLHLDWSPVLQYSPQKLQSSLEELEGEPKERKWPRRMRNTGADYQPETSFLYSLLDAPNSIKRLYLNHPLIAAFIHLREQKYERRFRWMQLVLAVYTLLYMAFVYYLYFNRCDNPDNEDDEDEGASTPDTFFFGVLQDPGSSTTEEAPPEKEIRSQRCEFNRGIHIAAYLLSVVVIVVGAFDIGVIIKGIDLKYVFSWRSWILRISYITMALTLWPAMTLKSSYRISWQYPFAALGTFFGWIVFLLQVEFLIPRVKIYLEILVTIVITVFKIIFLFLPMFVGFYMGFNLLFGKEGGVTLPGIMNFILMTVDSGSEQYDDMIDDATGMRKWLEALADLFSVAFIIVIAIVFMNFLLGASITDMQDLEREAKIMSLSHRVQNLYSVNLLTGKYFDVVTRQDIKDEKLYYQYKYAKSLDDGEFSLPPEASKLSKDVINKIKKFLGRERDPNSKASAAKKISGKVSAFLERPDADELCKQVLDQIKYFLDQDKDGGGGAGAEMRTLEPEEAGYHDNLNNLPYHPAPGLSPPVTVAPPSVANGNGAIGGRLWRNAGGSFGMPTPTPSPAPSNNDNLY